MKIFFPKVPVTRFLLLGFVALLLLLVVSKYTDYRKLRHNQATFDELLTKSVRRQQVLTSIIKGTDYARVHILNILLYPGADSNVVDEENIRAQVEKNDSDHFEFKQMIEGPRELELYSQVKRFRRLNSQTRKEIIQLVKDGKYKEASDLNESRLSHYYESFQAANTVLEAFVSNRDKGKIKVAETQLKKIENINRWTNLALVLVLLGLGILISRTIIILRNKKQLLEESELKYRTLIEQTNEIIEKCDADGKIIFANDSFKKKLGYSESELAHLNLSDILADPSQNLNKPLHGKGKVITSVERTFLSKEGRLIYLQGNILLDYKNNRFTGSTGFFNDITDKRHLEESLIASEKKFRNLFDLTPIPMWVIDSASFKFLLVNNAAINHYGYSEADFYQKTIFDIRPPEDVPRIREDIERWISEANGPQQFSKVNRGKSRHRKKSGEIIEVEIYNTPIVLHNQKDILSIAIDVTERNIQDQKLTKAIITAQEEERYEIGGELHDNVCQILAAAKMSLGMLKPSLDDEQIGLYERSQSSIVLATEEIRNLSHRLAPAFFDNTNLEKSFESLLKTFNIDKRYETVLFFDKAARELPLHRDVQLNLYRILQEQLRNIIKYAKGSLIEVDVLLHNQQLKMRIADNGVGFNIAGVKKGIGLANMKRRAELFSGKIDIISAPGNGCEVMVILPLNEIT